MTIRIECGGCGRNLGVGDTHAGMRARCPVCGYITLIPGVATFDTESPLPPGGAPSSGHVWRMRTPEGSEFGPVGRSEIDRWVSEGRVSWDCQLQSGADTWRSAAEFYPVLRPAGWRPSDGLAETTWTKPASGRSGLLGEGLPDAAWPTPPREPLSPDRGVRRPRSPAPSYAPSVGGSPYQAEHRGWLILGLALMAWFFYCAGWIFAPIAWALASTDLHEMDAGRMNASGRGITYLGKVLAIINVVTWLAFLAVVIIGVMMRM